jgi:hypothetical protein
VRKNNFVPLVSILFGASAISALTPLPDAYRLGVVSANALLLAYVCSRLCGILLPTYLTPQILIAIQTFQLAVLIVISVSHANTQFEGAFGPLPNVADHVLLVCGALLSVPAGVLLGCAAVRFCLPRKAGCLTLFRRSPQNIKPYLIASFVLSSARWFAGGENSGTVAYIIRILSSGLGIVPLVVGVFSEATGTVNLLCLTSLSVNAGIGVLMGTREPLFYLGLYLLGRTLKKKGERRILAAAALLLAGVPGIYLFAAIGEIRQELGRDSASLVSTDGLRHFVDALTNLRLTADIDQVTENQGLNRLFSWPNAVVTMMTPNPIPYRGLQDVPEEFLAYCHIWGSSPDETESFFAAELGTARANRYGFVVNAHTSVDFGLLADGWSRIGAVGAVLSGFLITLVFGLFERAVCLFQGLHDESRWILTALLVRVASTSHIYPPLYLIRELVLDFIVFGTLLFAVEVIFRLKAEKRVRQAWLTA